MADTAAQDEYNDLMSRNTATHTQQHPEDRARPSSDHITSSDIEDDDDAETRYPSAPTHDSFNRNTRMKLPNQRSYNNTGPKGVIADAQAFREAQAARSRETSQQRAPTTNTLIQPYVENLSINDSAREDSDSTLNDLSKAEIDALRNEEHDEDFEAEDEEFMLQWRLARLQELRSKSVIASNSAVERLGMSRHAKLVYEGLTAVDGEGYLEVVDGSPRSVTVIVFVWDDRSEVSTLIENCLRQLARKHKTTRFIKLHYGDAEMEPAGVPAVLAYRGGDKFAGLIPVVDEIPDDADLSPETLERVFQR